MAWLAMPALGALGFEWHRKRACASGGQGRHSRPATAQDSAASGDCEGALRGPAAAAGLLTGTPKAEHSRAQARRSPRPHPPSPSAACSTRWRCGACRVAMRRRFPGGGAALRGGRTPVASHGPGRGFSRTEGLCVGLGVLLRRTPREHVWSPAAGVLASGCRDASLARMRRCPS